jgi:hypothetical protein
MSARPGYSAVALAPPSATPPLALMRNVRFSNRPFVIDRSGYIANAHVDADYRNRPEPQEIVAICRTLQR